VLAERHMGLGRQYGGGDRRPSLQPVFAEADALDLLVVGSGSTLWQMPETMRRRLRELRVGLDIMLTSTAVRTYNILLAERRRIAAALIAVA